ncbi:MAG TPA: response regulator [Thermoanaerobaculia bacterium]
MTAKNILIVENDASTRKLVDVLLRRDGHSPIAVDSGQAAISVLGNNEFDLVILDLMMPVVSGQDVIEFIEQHSPATPVVLVTAAPPAVTSTLTSPVVRTVIRKPFNILELATAVDEYTRPVQAPAITLLIVEDDERARYVLRTMVNPANVIEVEDAEGALLAIQAQHPDAVLLDLALPGMPGEEFLRLLKDNPETSDIPIVIVTSRKPVEGVPEPQLARADGFIYKGDLSREKITTALKVVLKPRA